MLFLFKIKIDKIWGNIDMFVINYNLILRKKENLGLRNIGMIIN